MTRAWTRAACGVAASVALVLATGVALRGGASTAMAQESEELLRAKGRLNGNKDLREQLIDLRARVDILEERRDAAKASLSEVKLGLLRMKYARDVESPKDIERVAGVVAELQAEYDKLAHELARTRLDRDDAERRYREIRR